MERSKALGLLLVQQASANPALAATPPMGWMSWEIFRCETDCANHPDACIDERLYKAQARALVDGGYLAAGYETISIDDCWESFARVDGALVMNATRFPSGGAALGDALAALGVRFGIYSDEGGKTCGGYPGSEGFEAADAATFAGWGVGYLKLDGCYDDAAGFAAGYPKMGRALAQQNINITYSCSWPAYLGDDEAAKPFDAMVAAGCNLWRNWRDVQCDWASVRSIMDHWGNYSVALRAAAGPGHWNDPDMLLAGNDCVTDLEAQTQMAIWSMVAAPLIMGNDLRNVSEPMRALLLNDEIIAIDQDPLGKAGGRVETSGGVEVWTRDLAGGSLAIAVYFETGDLTATVDFAALGWGTGDAKVRDVLRRADLGVLRGRVAVVAPGDHATRLLKLERP